MHNNQRSIGRIIKFVFLGSIVVGLIGVISVIAMSIKGAPDIDAFEYIEEKHAPTKIYDDKGKQIDQFNASEWGEYISLDKIPKDFQHAMIVLEDENFYEHNGVDFKGIGRAVFNNLKNGSLSNGGTTITGQIIKNNIAFSKEHKVMQKLQEQYLALQLEKRYTKDQILEWYLNETGFGQGTVGIQAAAQRYFEKDASELSLTECVVIAATAEYPTKYNPILNPENNWGRAKQCLDKLVEAQYITEEQKERAVKENSYNRIQKVQSEYECLSVHNYFVEAVIEEVKEDLKNQCGYTDEEVNHAIYGGGLQIYTTLDLKAQQIVDKCTNEKRGALNDACEIALEYKVSAMNSQGTQIDKEAHETVKSREEIEDWKIAQKEAWGITNPEDIIEENLVEVPQPQLGFVLMDHRSGEVKALSGGLDKMVNRGFNYATQALRMPGTTFGILAAYAPALDMGKVSGETIVEDAPIRIELDNGHVYSPKNPDDQYKGKMTVREAARDQRNIVAIKILKDEVGLDNSYDYLKKFGFKHLEESDKTIALVQGGLTKGVTALELNAAYSAIANGGTYIKPLLYHEVKNAKGEVILNNTPNKTRVIKEETAHELTEILQSAVKEGDTGHIQKYIDAKPVAGVAGVVSSAEDMVFVGYTPDYSATMWMGYSKPKVLPEEVRNYELEIWAKIMSEVHKN